MASKNEMIDPADVQKVIDRHSLADENTDCKSVLGDVLRDLRKLLPRDYPEDMLGLWAVHPECGRVLVCSAKPDDDGQVGIALRDDDEEDGAYMVWVDPARLSFPEQHPETVTTREEYEALPVGSIVAEPHGTPFVRRGIGAAGRWVEDGVVYTDLDMAGTESQVLRRGGSSDKLHR